jgi:hypothetical protein
MCQQKAPEHAEFVKIVVAGLDCPHALLNEEADADVGCFDHGDVVGAVADGEGHFVETSADWGDDVCSLAG